MALFSPSATRDDYSELLASPAGFLPSPALGAGLFASPAPASKPRAAVKDGRLSFDMLQLEGEEAGGGLEGLGAQVLKATRSSSHLELFAVPKPVDDAAAAVPPPGAAPEQQRKEQLAALTERVAAKTVAAKQDEVAALVAGVAAKYGLAADYARAQDTIKAVWAEGKAPRAASPAADSGAPAKQQSQQQTGGGDSLTLAGRGSSDHVSCEEEGGQQATSALKPANAARAAAGDAPAQKRSLGGAPAFSFPAPAAPEPAGDDAAAKKRRVQYDHGRMREMEAEVQRLRHLGDALKQSLLQAQAQHTAATLENEQLWSALTHIHVSLRAAHAAHLRQQVAMHTAALLAAAPPPPPQSAPQPSPNTLFGGLFSPDADELAAACGMFVSPAKGGAGGAPVNKPRKLFLEEEAKAGGERPALGDPLPPSMWVQAA